MGWSGWWVGLISLALVLPTVSAGSGATGGPFVATIARQDAQPLVLHLMSASSPLDDDEDSRDCDDDSSDDDALLTGPVAVVLPSNRRIDYRALPAALHEPPESDELLRPPQSRVD